MNVGFFFILDVKWNWYVILELVDDWMLLINMLFVCVILLLYKMYIRNIWKMFVLNLEIILIFM